MYFSQVTNRCRRLRRALIAWTAIALVCAISSSAIAQLRGTTNASHITATPPTVPESPQPVDEESGAPVMAAQYGDEPSTELPPDAGQDMPYLLPGEGAVPADPGCPTGPLMNPACPPPRCLPLLELFGLRHSYTDGRNVGYGWPLVGTSWLNRPYYVGGTLGLLGTANRIDENVRPDVDVFGGLVAGWDWDYYWGSEVQFERSTPEFTNSLHPEVRAGKVMELWSYDAMYYPWGDSAVRPFWRLGLGSTYVDYVSDSGHRRDEELWTFPIGVGIKYPIYHWLAARIEFTDHLALGNRGVNTMNDLTLVCGLEWHFGAQPQSYWPWNPSRHIW